MLELFFISGGGQERGLRSGTLAPALVVGMGEAARIAAQDMDFDTEWIKKLANKLKRYVQKTLYTLYLF